MSNPRVILQNKFVEGSRYANFGNVIMRMHIKGVRCHENTLIDIKSPITAFCGLNGTGKSTLLQLASAAYKRPDTLSSKYYIREFIVETNLDKNPVDNSASVEYRFWESDRSLKHLTLSWSSSAKRWRGYNRCPARRVFFSGCGIYLPKIEKKDFTIREATRLVLEKRDEVTTIIKDWTCRILGKSYENIYSNTVTYSNSRGKVISVKADEDTYSEAHMGFGEARSQNIVHILEALPDKSLILIEEPETSLHQSAQHEFGQYLVDVSIRKGHQILITTHSEFVLETLPSESRIYLHRSPAGMQLIPGLTATQAKSLMSEGHVKALVVLVEDICAHSVLTEIIRRIDSELLSAVGIYPTGDNNTIKTIVEKLRDTGLPVVAVRDGDMPEIPSQNIFKLPGSLPPEKEIFANNAVVQYVRETYRLDLRDFSARLTGVDHHQWFKKLATHISQDEIALMRELGRIYANNLLETEAESLVNQLKESVRK